MARAKTKKAVRKAPARGVERQWFDAQASRYRVSSVTLEEILTTTPQYARVPRTGRGSGRFGRLNLTIDALARVDLIAYLHLATRARLLLAVLDRMREQGALRLPFAMLDEAEAALRAEVML